MKPSIAHLYFRTAILLLITGMLAGIVMAASGAHSVASAHAHLNLLGFVVTSIYGGYFALFPDRARGLLPRLVYGLHTTGTVAMVPALVYLLTGHPEIEPVVAIASLVVAAGAVSFAVAVFRPAA